MLNSQKHQKLKKQIEKIKKPQITNISHKDIDISALSSDILISQTSPRFRGKPNELILNEACPVIIPNLTLEKLKTERQSLNSLGKKFYKLDCFRGKI